MKEENPKKFQVHVSPKVFAIVKKLAKKRGLSMSAFLGEIIMREIAKEIVDAS